MSSSASGPIGALLLIAPLAAIPVFAIVGLPQFAPLAASPAEDDDLAETASPGTASGNSSTPSGRRKADDLFAPIGAARPGNNHGLAAVGTRDESSSESKTLGASFHDQNSGSRMKTAAWTPPAGALDGWELGSSTEFADLPAGREQNDRRKSPRENNAVLANAPDSAAVDAGFDPGLLQTETPRSRVAAPEKRPVPAARPEGSSLPRSRGAGPKEIASSNAAADMAEFYGKQGWLAAAARLRELGIRNYQLEWVVEDQRFVFWCTVPAGRDNRVSNRFEAQDEEPLYAVQKTLADVEASLGRARR